MNRKGKSKTQVYPVNNSQVSAIPSENPLLSYIDEESLHSMKDVKNQDFYPYYHGQKQWYIARLWFWHFFKYTQKLRNNVINLNQSITPDHLPKLSQSEDIQQNLYFIQQSIKGQRLNGTDISWTFLLKTIFLGEQKSQVISIFLGFIGQSVAKNGVSLVMSFVIRYIMAGDIISAYGFGGLLISLNLMSIFCFHHAQSRATKFSSRTRMTLVTLVYFKLTELSSFSIKAANMGKILNLMSGDINALDFLLVIIFQTLVVPINLTFASIILWQRFGPVGLIAIVITFINYTIQLLVQFFNRKTIQKAKGYSDKRLKFISELISGIRIIKMYAWGEFLTQLISNIRKNEIASYFLIQLRSLLDRLFSSTSQAWGSVLFFIILHYGGFTEELLVPDMIATIQLLTFIKFSSVFLMSYGIQSILMIRISLERISQILNIQNVEMTCIEPSIEIAITTPHSFTSAIFLSNFSAYWNQNAIQDNKAALKSITLRINYGECWAIIGRNGSGKTTLLKSLLFEIPAFKGTIKFNGKTRISSDIKISYVEQEPFIFPESIRKNILFGKTYNKLLYDRVLQVTQLDNDIIGMKFQDFTEIGERGVTLSGGQKARISLARALYQLSDIYLFDDPLSAVDAQVARNIFYMAIKNFIFKEQCLYQPNKNPPSVILVTHQVQYALQCTKIGVMANGTIIAQGEYDEIKQSLSMLNEELAQQFEKAIDENDEQFVEPVKIRRYRLKKAETHNLIGKELMNDAEISWKAYKRYFNYWNIIIVITLLILDISSEVIYNIYLKLISQFNTLSQSLTYNVSFQILGSLIAGQLVLVIVKYILNLLSVQKISHQLHQQMLTSIIRAPFQYYDVNPSGRVINRFSNDLMLADTQANQILSDIQDALFNFILALIILATLQPYFIILIAFVITGDVYLFFYSKKIISQLKQIELNQRSPLFDFLIKTVSGVIQVRLYGQLDWFKQQFLSLANQANISTLTYNYAARSFAFHIDIMGFIVQAVGIFMIIALNDRNLAEISNAILLLSIFNDSLNWGLRLMINFDTQMNSYNRMFEIIDIPPESADHLPKDDTIDFPETGTIDFINVHMKYRNDSELTLKGLTFRIESGQKVGFVGRTGAGKSSIIQVLFRMTEILPMKDSKLIIGDVDIRQIGLIKLRSNICIIPQAPFLFSGTIRRNLDPFLQFTDEQLWKALFQTSMDHYVTTLQHGLHTDMSDADSIFSVGQKQLICLARAILNQRKIIVLDEATANVDMKTDDMIQETLKTQFQDCTVITIAHRLNTIADYDKILVIDKGMLSEFGSPFSLLANNEKSTTIDKDSIFASLVRQTGLENSLVIFEAAKEKYMSVLNQK